MIKRELWKGVLVLRKYFLMFTVILSLLIGACSNSADEKIDENNHEVTSVNDGSMGDLREETSDKGTLPNFLDKHDDNMKIVYQAVAEHKELLEHVPCYCGCNDSVGHEHNYHCFIHENKADGQVVWDDHATRCQVCLDIAVESVIEYENGKSINEIQDMIDEKYEDKGYPESTPTPKFTS